MKLAIFLAALLTSTSSAENKVKPLRLKLPTLNTGLVTGDLDGFYMYTNRNLEATKSRPWTGGKWGYSREFKLINNEFLSTKFHEGIDIRPLKRDSANRPLDIVQSIADGEVVHTNTDARYSNYGKYVVVKHDWGYGPFYSLYAHLAKITCNVGQPVRAESPLGRMGYTGVGLDITRAHLHLELGIMMNDNYSDWHNIFYKGSPNHHDIYNGINLNGIDIATLFLSNHKNPKLTIPEFLKNTPVYYKVTIPRTDDLFIAKTYPWIKKGDHSKASPSWEISFSSSAFPLSVAPSQQKVIEPTVTSVIPSKFNHSYRSRGLLTGSGTTVSLNKYGKRQINLIASLFKKAVDE